jgi:hypothetical protein
MLHAFQSCRAAVNCQVSNMGYKQKLLPMLALWKSAKAATLAKGKAACHAAPTVQLKTMRTKSSMLSGTSTFSGL